MPQSDMSLRPLLGVAGEDTGTGRMHLQRFSCCTGFCLAVQNARVQDDGMMHAGSLGFQSCNIGETDGSCEFYGASAAMDVIAPRQRQYLD